MKRSEIFRVRLTKGERELLDEVAAQTGETRSELVRGAVTSKAFRILEQATAPAERAGPPTAPAS